MFYNFRWLGDGLAQDETYYKCTLSPSPRPTTPPVMKNISPEKRFKIFQDKETASTDRDVLQTYVEAGAQAVDTVMENFKAFLVW